MDETRKIILPKTNKDGEYYVSYSQISQWKKSKREYIRCYFLKEKQENAGLQKYADFGHKVGQAFENNDYSAFEPNEQEFLKSLPKYDEFETEVRLQFDGWHLIGYADTNTNSKDDGYVKKIIDFKTGEISKRKVDYESEDYHQLAIYAGAFRQKYGKLPDEATVVLIDREGNAFRGEELKLTGRVEFIPKDISAEIVDSVVAEVQKTAEEISRYYKAYLKLNGLI